MFFAIITLSWHQTSETFVECPIRLLVTIITLSL
jgi:hypothetical protein